jgi:hypothetical protein
MTAEHANLGVLDTTATDLGCAFSWEQVHRVRPRAPLSCRGCGGGLQAKVSKLGLRFFAHDAAVSDCPLNGESAAHRLLKSALAGAIRQAGWTAELEVAGTGWRADVLALSPDGTRRVAWEAQLATATRDELAARTTTMLGELDGVCWVTDKDAIWLCQVPSARVAYAEDQTLTVVDGVARFVPGWCDRRDHCESWGQHGYYRRDPGPCPGHGDWQDPERLTLVDLVAAVCADRVRPHEVSAFRRSSSPRYPVGKVVWTARRYVQQEAEQLDATAAVEARTTAARVEQSEHEARIAALLARQQALVLPTIEIVHRETGVSPRVGGPDPKWAMGLPVHVGGEEHLGGTAHAVISPVASRIDQRLRRRFAPLLLVVADERERKRVAAVCDPKQRIVVVPVGVATTPAPAVSGGISVQQAVRTLVWGS